MWKSVVYVKEKSNTNNMDGLLTAKHAIYKCLWGALIVIANASSYTDLFIHLNFISKFEDSRLLYCDFHNIINF